MTVLEEACPLCSSIARLEEFDSCMRRDYLCEQGACGRFIITRTARNFLAEPSRKGLRSELTLAVKERQGREKIPEIWMETVNGDKQLSLHMVARR